MSYTCSECAKTFARKYNLARHIEHIHQGPQKFRSVPLFICDSCNKPFHRKKNFERHFFKVHASDAIERSKIICSYCIAAGTINRFLTRKYLREHCVMKHNLQFNEETLIFSSMSEFKNWQLGIHESTLCHFISTGGVRRLANGMKKYYLVCHHDGYVKLISDSVRKKKSKGSYKINASCTAQMIVTVDDKNSTVRVQYISTHCEHDYNTSRALVAKDERAYIAAKMKEVVPIDAIVNEMGDSINNIFTDNVLLCLTKQEIQNIQCNFPLHTGCQHANDFISIKLWICKVQDLGEKSPILYFNEQSLGEDENSEYNDDNCDMILIIANDFQLSMLKEFGNNIVCIDSTHGTVGTEVNDFHLTTLVVVDEFGCGIPTAFCISNRQNTAVWATFFLKLRDHVGILEAQVFMSDIDDSFYNGWKAIMKPVPKRLLCWWHIDRAWMTNLQAMIKDEDKRAFIYQALQVLLQETNIDKFDMLIDDFLKDTYDDNDTTEFALYFDDVYAKRVHEWAYCFRKAIGISTNIYLESLHKIFRYYYLQGRKNKRLDTCIDALLRLIRDHYFRRLQTICKNEPFQNEDTILQSHHEATSENIGEITQISDRIWFVASSTDTSITYEVTKILNEKEDCFLNSTCFCTCILCQICIHTYSCECIDYVIKNNICKHIHFCVSQTRMKLDDYSGDLPKVYEDNITMIKPCLSPVSQPPSNCYISLLKQKLETLLGYLMNENLTDDDFTDEEKSIMTKNMDEVMDFTTRKTYSEPDVTWQATS